jgi:hypothetical protein
VGMKTLRVCHPERRVARPRDPQSKDLLLSFALILSGSGIAGCPIHARASVRAWVGDTLPPMPAHDSPANNKLYYGDNLAVLRDYIADRSVDLIYLDPPFNSRQDYNVLFAEKDGSRSASQITAFKDTWEWNIESERAYEKISKSPEKPAVEQGGRVADAMRAFRTLLGGSDMLAYLAMMAPRASSSSAPS